MEFVFDMLAEIIFEPILKGYLLVMSHFSGSSEKKDEDKVKTAVVFECIVLLILFVVGGCMLLETDGKSLFGKIFLITSVTVSVVQILVGIVLNNLKKNSDEKIKMAVSYFKKSEKELFVNGGYLHISGEKIVLKSFFRKVALFSIDEVKFRKLPDELLFNAVEISDKKKSYVLLFTKGNYLKLCENVKM